ncbi:MAG: sigma-54-dependent Fis family transcriptional regulator [Phycisphaerales bacterium]|nr:sigma-54 dependent transcriptional regulator [Phycisphaerae bacterium]NNF42608.1 sigma-54-dependent Fis family transcriptional regulator [Phycisphaerales bacterium]NNM26181.1 sigma-54-dependent Fis family transcriptional regulator [Phycisphaerales bacterium]
MSHSILIVEDEQVLRESLAGLLEDEGYDVHQAADGEVAHRFVLERPVDLVLSDVRMPVMDGLELLERLKQVIPETPVIMITAFGTVGTAVTAMRAGAWDYLLKPVQFDDLLLKIKRALEVGELRRTHRVVSEQLAAGSAFHDIVSESPNMLSLFDLAEKLSSVRSNVLIIGESGTGKELFARAIHYSGVTRSKAFVPVNCGAIPESLIESELFGHRKGAFTGAIRDKIGYFEAAHGGTLFLDELSALPTGVQTSLLRVLEERVVVPVGDTSPRMIDVRVIGASNQDLDRLVTKGVFREDLLFRLNVVRIDLPPLRQRRSDIPLLAQHFIQKFTTQMNKRVSGITNGAMRALLGHEWRGNVRELQNVIERAVIFAEDRAIDVGDLPFETDADDNASGEDLREALRQFERQHIIYSLRRHRFDKTATARDLGIGISSLYRKLEELEIPKAESPEAEPPGVAEADPPPDPPPDTPPA